MSDNLCTRHSHSLHSYRRRLRHSPRRTREITFISVTPNISSESVRLNCCPVNFILFASAFETVQCFACEFWSRIMGSPRQHSILIVVFLCMIRMRAASMQRTNETSPMEQPFVDILSSDYFKIEQNLWMMIENRADNVLLHVFRTHERFFNQTISESASGVLMRDLVPGMSDIVQTAGHLNATAELGYNHLREQDVERKSITDYANSSLKILKNASDLFEMAMKASFWESIINVSKFARNADTANEVKKESESELAFFFLLVFFCRLPFIALERVPQPRRYGTIIASSCFWFLQRHSIRPAEELRNIADVLYDPSLLQ